MTQPSRFEATLNLACAAMTMLMCGRVADLEMNKAAGNRFISLREEFADLFRVHAHYIERLAAHCCQDIERAYKYDRWNRVEARVRFLLDTRQLPSTIQKRIDAEKCKPDQASRIRMASDLGVDTRDISYVAHAKREAVNLDRAWKRLRTALIDWDNETFGGAE
jgi:hypothetical protein